MFVFYWQTFVRIVYYIQNKRSVYTKHLLLTFTRLHRSDAETRCTMRTYNGKRILVVQLDNTHFKYTLSHKHCRVCLYLDWCEYVILLRVAHKPQWINQKSVMFLYWFILLIHCQALPMNIIAMRSALVRIMPKPSKNITV